MIKAVRFILAVTADAPKLPMSLERAAQYIDWNAAAVQQNFYEVLGCTFALRSCLTYRSPNPAPWNLWLLYGELLAKGRIVLPVKDTAYYMLVWHPQPMEVAGTGTYMGSPVGYALDGAGVIEDYLGMDVGKQPFNPGSTMQNQARGRDRHEIDHILGGPHPERIFGAWWDYGMGIPYPTGPERDEEFALLNKDWLVIK